MTDEEVKKLQAENRRLHIYSTIAVVIGVLSICVNIATNRARQENGVAETSDTSNEASVVESSSTKLHSDYGAARDINKALSLDNIEKCYKSLVVEGYTYQTLTIEKLLRYTYKDIDTNEDYSYIFSHINLRKLGYCDGEVFPTAKLGEDGRDFIYLKRDTSVHSIVPYEFSVDWGSDAPDIGDIDDISDSTSDIEVTSNVVDTSMAEVIETSVQDDTSTQDSTSTVEVNSESSQT